MLEYLTKQLAHLKRKRDRFWGKDRGLYDMYMMSVNVMIDTLISYQQRTPDELHNLRKANQTKEKDKRRKIQGVLLKPMQKRKHKPKRKAKI